MGPPFDDKGLIQPDAPLKAWSHVESFDSARECEASQFERTQRAYEALRKVQDAIHKGAAKIAEATTPTAKWAFANRSLCIGSGDPRLR